MSKQAAILHPIARALAGRRMMRTAVVFWLIMPMAASSAMMAESVARGVAGHCDHIQATDTRTWPPAFQRQRARAPPRSSNVLADREKRPAQAADMAGR